jgi:hypothetical protein
MARSQKRWWRGILARGAGTLHRAGMADTAVLSWFWFVAHTSTVPHHRAAADGI